MIIEGPPFTLKVFNTETSGCQLIPPNRALILTS